MTEPAQEPPGANPARPARPADRYGDTRPPWHRVVARTGAAVAAVGAATWLVWAGLHQAQPPVRYDDIGFRVDGVSSVEVTFDVIVDPGSTVRCRLEALNRQYAVVGVAEVWIGPTSQQVTRSSADIATQELAVTGLVSRCDVP